ncbi:hypothetical protein GIB67_018174 [Kingdonia uniflora]|uniref:C3H1-type domain-containing protein n=1 Tax=Kingdonia uniflora TaxID=39325 RepID=A0A7J7NMX4_9MAGN|nr:hypothetical protein GIB67_018174 [Kingdonia uniflora]
MEDANHLTIDTDDSFSSLFELAANNNFDGFKRSLEYDSAAIDEVGLWYGRKKGSNNMAVEHRTPLMVAATYGSVEVLKLILSLSQDDVNRSCGSDKSTALHCAASGGSVNSADVVKLLLLAGADPNSIDANGCSPSDIIVIPPKHANPNLKSTLEILLKTTKNLSVSSSSNTNSPPLSSSPETNGSSSSPSESYSTSSPMMNLNLGSVEFPQFSVSVKKEYPSDSSLPDINTSNYATDEFRMFTFKVKPCSRAYSHDWTECPFVHPGENARRRDPRKFHYSCVPCPDFRKGACRRGDMCEYAHGVFECWLHPAQYRTRPCKDGINCMRRVCFFAHKTDELRHLSTGSAVLSPRCESPASHFSPPLSPSGISWPPLNVPTLNLPGCNLQSSRLRSSFNARDIRVDDCYNNLDFEQQMVNDLSYLRSSSPSVNCSMHSKSFTPSNLDDLFALEIPSSPRYFEHRSAFLNQCQQQQNFLSPINTVISSPRNINHPLLQHGSYSLSSSPGRSSPVNMEPMSPLSPSLFPFAAQREKQQQLRSLSSRDLGGSSLARLEGSPIWGSSNGKVDWSLNNDELGKLRRSASLNNRQEQELTWVHALFNEPSPPQNMEERHNNVHLNTEAESTDTSALGAWLDQMQLDKANY